MFTLITKDNRTIICDSNLYLPRYESFSKLIDEIKTMLKTGKKLYIHKDDINKYKENIINKNSNIEIIPIDDYVLSAELLDYLLSLIQNNLELVKKILNDNYLYSDNENNEIKNIVSFYFNKIVRKNIKEIKYYNKSYIKSNIKKLLAVLNMFYDIKLYKNDNIILLLNDFKKIARKEDISKLNKNIKKIYVFTLKNIFKKHYKLIEEKFIDYLNTIFNKEVDIIDINEIKVNIDNIDVNFIKKLLTFYDNYPLAIKILIKTNYNLIDILSTLEKELSYKTDFKKILRNFDFNTDIVINNNELDYKSYKILKNNIFSNLFK